MTAGVYAIINTVTGHRYIGSTRDFETRRRAHQSGLRSGYIPTNGRLSAAVKEHGGESFTIELIEHVEPDEAALEAAEERWLLYYADLDRDGLYNIYLTARRPTSAYHQKSRPPTAAPGGTSGEEGTG